MKGIKNPEAQFSAWLRRKLPGQICRVENCLGAGMPDIYMCDQTYGHMWIETKIAHNGAIFLEKEQYAWGMRNYLCGGRVRIIALDSNDEVIIHHFPITIAVKGRYVGIISTPHCRVVKSEFNCGLLV
jgi:hypothetical protein